MGKIQTPLRASFFLTLLFLPGQSILHLTGFILTIRTLQFLVGTAPKALRMHSIYNLPPNKHHAGCKE